jgi:hypothetical protein
MEQSSDRGSPRDDSTDRTDPRSAHRPAHRAVHRPAQNSGQPPAANPPYHSSNLSPEQRPSRPSDRPEHWPDSWFAGPPYPEPRQLDPRDLEGRTPHRDPGPIPRWDGGDPPRESYPDRYSDSNSYGHNDPSERRQTSQPNAYVATVSGGRSESSSLPLSMPQIQFERWGRGLGIWVVGSLILAGLVLLVDPSRVISRWSGGDNSQCQEVVQPQSILSREQLVKLLAIPERSAKSKIRQVLREPYCYLASLKIRAGVLSQREAYPLEFDTDMWLVILYEGEEYAGYRFSPR